MGSENDVMYRLRGACCSCRCCVNMNVDVRQTSDVESAITLLSTQLKNVSNARGIRVSRKLLMPFMYMYAHVDPNGGRWQRGRLHIQTVGRKATYGVREHGSRKHSTAV